MRSQWGYRKSKCSSCEDLIIPFHRNEYKTKGLEIAVEVSASGRIRLGRMSLRHISLRL